MRMVRWAVAPDLGLVQLAPMAADTSNQYVPLARLPLVQELPATAVAATV
ncbi:MAG TPA: hypothetical protein VJ838_02755 [Gaiellaceae bacterium]|nr:hypothetical protein [Gaiellaceae bacterium]